MCVSIFCNREKSISNIVNYLLKQKIMRITGTQKKGLLLTCSMALAFLMSSCAEKPQNVLTDAEKAEGWELLFDGKTLNGWRDYNGTSLTGPWEVVDGTIQADGKGDDANGYIVTDKQYENFELSWDWKLLSLIHI